MRSIHPYYVALVVTVAVHAYLSVVHAPTVSGTLGLGEETVALLRFSFLLLYWLAWYFGLRAVIAIHAYSRRYRDNPRKEKGFTYVGYGLLLLVANLALTSIISAAGDLAGENKEVLKWLTIVTNYLYVFVPIVGIWFIYAGARLLTVRELAGIGRRDNAIVATLFALVVTALYAGVIFTNTDRRVAVDADTQATFFLSDPLILLTIIVPSFVLWVLSVLGAFSLDRFTFETLTENERRAKKKMVNGIWIVIFSSIAYQGIAALGVNRLLDLGLGYLIVILYGLVMLIVYAHFTVMRGARALLREAARGGYLRG